MTSSPVIKQQPTGPDNPAGIDVASMIDFANKAAAAFGATFSDLQKNAATAEGAIAESNAAIQSRAAAEQTVTGLEVADLLTKQAKNLESSAWFGTNKDASGFILAGLGENIRNSQADLEARRSEIQKKLDTGFLDDPMAWIINQITIPFDEASLNFKKASVNEDVARAQQIIKLTDDQIKNNNATEAGDLLARATAMKEIIAAKAADDVAKNKLALAQQGISNTNIRVALTKGQFDMINAANNAIVQDWTIRYQAFQMELSENADERAAAGLVLQQAADARAERSFKLQEELKNFQIEMQKGSLEARQSLQARLDRWSAVTGRERIGVDEFNRMQGVTKQLIDQQINDPDIIENGRIDYKPSGVLTKSQVFQFPLSPASRPVLDFLSSTQAAVIDKFSKPGAVMWQNMKPEQQAREVDKAVDSKLREERANIPERGSIYSPPTAYSLFGKKEVPDSGAPFAKNTYIAKAMTGQAMDERTPLRANDVITAALTGIYTEGKTPAQMAAEVAQIYTGVINQNNEQRQYMRLAVPPLSQVTSGFKQNVIVPDAGFMNKSNEILDLSNAAAVESFLTRAMIRRSQTIGAK